MPDAPQESRRIKGATGRVILERALDVFSQLRVFGGAHAGSELPRAGLQQTKYNCIISVAKKKFIRPSQQLMETMAGTLW